MEPTEGRPPPAAAASHEIGDRTYLIADVEPLDVTGVRTVGFGTLLFAVAFLVMLPMRDQLEDDGRGWWLWTCVAGFALGVFGYFFCRHRARRGPRPEA